MADLGAWKSLQEAVIAGSAQADRLAARVMRAESTDAGRAELLGKLIQESAVGTNTFRETSHSFTLVLRDFYSDILFKNADDIVELFTTRGVWISCRNVKDLDDAIARDCKWLWAPSGPSRPGEMPCVPTPFNDDAWHSARREAILKGASRSESQPLDAQCRFKLLFPPAEDDPRSVAMVYNFLTDETRPAQPGDRLYMRTNFPYKPFEVSEATERIVDNFMELYFNWHLVGSGLLDGEEEDGGEEVKRALAKVLTCPDLEWFRGQAAFTKRNSFLIGVPGTSRCRACAWGASRSPQEGGFVKKLLLIEALFTKMYSGVRSQILSAIPTVPGGTLMG